MNAYADKTAGPIVQAPDKGLTAQKSMSKAAVPFSDKRPEVAVQRKLQETVKNSPRVLQMFASQKMATNRASVNLSSQTVQQMENHEEEAETLQGKFKTIQRKGNNTALPANQGNLMNVRRPVPSNTAVIQMVNAPKKKKAKSKKKTPSLFGGTVTVRNKTDDYSSGLIDQTTRAHGVNAGPRAEAQRVANLLGGSWVGGHMVNDSLGGTGGYSNIVPITSSMNGLHKFMENKANNILNGSSGSSIEYQMEILKRATVKYPLGGGVVKNLPIEFQQTLYEHPLVGKIKKTTGPILIEDRPGQGKIQ